MHSIFFATQYYKLLMSRTLISNHYSCTSSHSTPLQTTQVCFSHEGRITVEAHYEGTGNMYAYVTVTGSLHLHRVLSRWGIFLPLEELNLKTTGDDLPQRPEKCIIPASNSTSAFWRHINFLYGATDAVPIRSLDKVDVLHLNPQTAFANTRSLN
jgi:hypothetical protein